jgi:ferrous-iron efflux pump FieF
MEYSKLNIRAGIFAIATAGSLIALKLYAWVETDSLSIFSSLIDSSLDLATSVINLLAIGYALKPADDDHPYGHDSIEDIVGLLQAAFIFGSGFFICYEGLQRFYRPVTITNNDLGISVMIISILFTVALVTYQKITIRKTRSIVVESDSIHYVTDVLSGALIIISLLLSRSAELSFIDPVLAIAISIYIALTAFKIGKRAFDNLMNKEIDIKDKNRIIEIINSNKKHNGFHDMKTRSSGNKIFIQFDLEMDGSLSLQQAHDIAQEVMDSIMKEYKNSEVVIHFDPEKD